MAKLRLVVPPAVIAVLLLVPGLARASEVHIAASPDHAAPCCSYGSDYSDNDSVYYVADPGERNRVVLSSGTGTNQFNDLTVHDPGAVIRAGDHCVSIDQHTARCQGESSLSRPQVHLGDEGDEVRISEAGGLIPNVYADGGPGDDLLVGGPNHDWLVGGGGHDMLFGGGYNDILDDGDATGAPGDAGPGPDLADGGAGRDLVTYQRRTAPVTVDLGSGGPAGEAGEGDQLRDIENAVGGGASDRLAGTAFDNELRGRGGADVLTGRQGKDRIYGGSGRDRIDAGDGDDFLDPGDQADDFSCGLGNDVIVSPAPAEVIGRCELMTFDLTRAAGARPGEGSESITLPPHPESTSKTALRFLIACPEPVVDDGISFPCAGTLKVREASGRRRLLGKVVRLPNRKRRAVPARVRLNSLGRKLIRRRGGVLATVVMRGAKSSLPLPAIAWTIRLRL
jgi:hemolysin type calcium-binding protein